MNIDVKLWYEKFQGVIDIKYQILLVLASLHYEKKITDAKLKGQIKALRAGTLQSFKNTYHCEITDRWYNYESAYEVFSDCIHDKGLTLIPFDEFIKYIQSFENKGYNHAVNVFGAEYIYRMFNWWNPEYNTNVFSDYINFDKNANFYIPGIHTTNDSYTCYVCGHNHYKYSKNEKENIKVINEWLHNKKKGNLKKIPYFSIESRIQM